MEERRKDVLRVNPKGELTKTGLCVIAVFLFAAGCFEKQSSLLNSNKPVPEVAGSKLLSVEEMTEDLEYAIGVVGDVHPQTYRGFSQEQKRLIESLRAKITEPMEARKFYFRCRTSLAAGWVVCEKRWR